MARPPVPSWATDTNFVATAGIDPAAIGGLVRREPTAGQKAQGDVPGLGYVAEYHNWLLGTIADNCAWLQGLIDSGGDFNYETPKYKRNVYHFGHGFDPFERASGAGGVANWRKYDGKSIVSQGNDSCWVVPLRGLPADAEVKGILIRVKTNNGNAGRGPFARFEVIRYDYNRLSDLSNPLTYDSGPNPGWEIFTHGFTPPGPYVGDFPHFNFETFAGTTSNPFFIETGFEYAVRIWAGTDVGPHTSDEFFGVFVDWRDHGPRSGG